MITNSLVRKAKKLFTFIIINVMIITFSIECLATTNWENFINGFSSGFSATLNRWKTTEAPDSIGDMDPIEDPDDDGDDDDDDDDDDDETYTEVNTYYYASYIEGHVYEINTIDDDFGTDKTRPIKGAFAFIEGSGGSNNTVVTDETGYYKLNKYTLPKRWQNFRFRYGYLGDLNGQSALDVANVQDILKFNGYDYLVSQITASGINDNKDLHDTEAVNVFENEIKRGDKGAAQVYLLIDASKSMCETMTLADGTETLKFDYAVDSAKTLIESLLDCNRNIYIGIIGYAGNSWKVADLSKNRDYLFNQLDLLKEKAETCFSPNTNIKGALELANDSFRISSDFSTYEDHCNRNIVLISDGIPTSSSTGDASLNLLSTDSSSVCNNKLKNILSETETKLNELVDDDINIMVISTKTDDPYEKQIAEKLYESTSKYIMADSDLDLATKLKNDVKEWMVSNLKDAEKPAGYDCIETTSSDAEDALRRKIVDDAFGTLHDGRPIGVFYNNVRSNVPDSSTTLSAKSIIFNEIEKSAATPHTPTAAAKELSNATYMESKTTECFLDPTAKSRAQAKKAEWNAYYSTYAISHSVTMSTINENKFVVKVWADFGTTQQSYKYYFEDVPIEIDMYIQRRETASLALHSTITAAKIVSSDDKVLAFHQRDLSSTEPFLEVIDDDIAHGATILFEYTIAICNDSSATCNYVELVGYVPREYMYSDETNILTVSGKKNKDFRWRDRMVDPDFKIDNLKDAGYITQEACDTHKDNNVLTLRICDPKYDGMSQDSLLIEGFSINPGSEFLVKLVLSRVINLADDCTGEVKADFELMGYRNLSFRRITIDKSDIANNSDFTIFTGYYPGNNDEIDFCTQSNMALIVPPTGAIKNEYNPILYIIPAVTVFTLTGLLYIKKKKKK